MSYLSKFKFNALKNFYKRYIVNKRIIQSIVFFSILIMSIAFFSTYSSGAKIGTCYTWGAYPYPRCGNTYVNLTGIESFRFRMDWGEMEIMLDDSNMCDGSLSELADSIAAAYPPDVEEIFMLKFYHPTKMIETNTDLVYAANPDSLHYFIKMCGFLGSHLVPRGIHTFVIHNEPNIGWIEIQGPPLFVGGKKWMSGYDAYASQCSTCIKAIRDSASASYEDSIYIIFGSFSGDKDYGVDTTGPIKGFTDAMDSTGIDYDCIDFHVYMDSVGNATLMDDIIEEIDSFATGIRGKDWSILETCGPLVQFPTADTVGTKPIVRHLINYVGSFEPDFWSNNRDSLEEEFIDSLYTLTRIAEPGHMLLPESLLTVFEPYVIEEFYRRVPPFDSAGAKFVHWFAAWRDKPYGFPGEDAWVDMDLPDWKPSEIATKLIKQAKFFPRHILNADDTSSATAFSDTMSWYIENHSLGRQWQSSRGEVVDNPKIPILSNYPNVFNASTRIDYVLPESGHARLEIYDLMGRKVEVLVDEYKVAGNYSVIWNAQDYPSGIYFCKLTQGSLRETKKMGLVK